MGGEGSSTQNKNPTTQAQGSRNKEMMCPTYLVVPADDQVSKVPQNRPKQKGIKKRRLKSRKLVEPEI
jgi:hypothetical protein